MKWLAAPPVAWLASWRGLRSAVQVIIPRLVSWLLALLMTPLVAMVPVALLIVWLVPRPVDWFVLYLMA